MWFFLKNNLISSCTNGISQAGACTQRPLAEGAVQISSDQIWIIPSVIPAGWEQDTEGRTLCYRHIFAKILFFQNQPC